MKSIIILGLFTLLSFTNSTYKMDLDYIRLNYAHAIKDKALCDLMISDLEHNKSSLLHLGYLGALQTIAANHTSNPLKKLKTFKKGRLNIEKAIKNDNENIEIRFLRYSVQKNCPSFLGYSQNIREDRNFLNLNKDKVTSENLKIMIEDILKN